MRERPRDGYSTVRSFSTPEEASIAAAALRASDIPVVLGNAHTAAVDWRMVAAMGGIQLMAPTFMLAEARALLRERATPEPGGAADPGDDAYEPARRKDRWKARLLLVYLFGPVAAFAVALICDAAGL